MVGDPAAPIIASARAFGARKFDLGAALAGLERAAEEPEPGPFVYPSNRTPPEGSRFGPFVERPGLADYLSLGYIPFDQRSGTIWGTSSTTLEYAVADFAISRLAEAAGDGPGAATFLARSAAWRHLFNPATGYIEPRNADGSFPAAFSPVSDAGFVEGNATQYTWFVPQDVAGLVAALGRGRAVSRLDSLLSHLDTNQAAPYAWLGNEPTFGVPWLPLWLGRPAVAQRTVSRALGALFHPWPAGLPGDDDLGAVSAWYVWSALGLYPAIPGVRGVVLGSPLFGSATIRAGGRTISIGASPQNGGPYVRGLTVDGRPYARTWLALPPPGSSLRLRFQRAARPQTWGSHPGDAPPSFAPEP
jgi:predicted alpha-1,2-mannosidase